MNFYVTLEESTVNKRLKKGMYTTKNVQVIKDGRKKESTLLKRKKITIE